MKHPLYLKTILALIVFYQVVVTCLWWKDEYSAYGGDSVLHLSFMITFHDLLCKTLQDEKASTMEKVGFFYRMMTEPIIHDNLMWPHLVYLMSSIALSIDRSHFAARFPMLIFFVILILSTFLVAERIGGGACGLVSAGLVSLYPLVFELSRQYGLDFPLTAMTMLVIWLLMKTEEFQRRGWSLGAGIILGLTLYIKIQVLFLIGPLFLLMVISIVFRRKNQPRPPGGVMINVTIFLLSALLLGLPWWINVDEAIISYMNIHFLNSEFLVASDAGTKDPFSLRLFLWYFPVIFWSSLGVMFSLFCLFGFLCFLGKSGLWERRLLIVFLFNFILVFILFNMKQERYFVPLLPLITIFGVTGFSSMISSGYFKTSAIVLLFAAGIFQHLWLSFAYESFDRSWFGQKRQEFSTGYNTIRWPWSSPWAGQLIAQLRSNRKTAEPVRILVFSFGPARGLGQYNPDIVYWTKLIDPKLEFTNFFYDATRTLRALDGYDYIVAQSASGDFSELRSGELSKSISNYIHPYVYRFFFPNPKLENFLDGIGERHRPIARIDYPDGDVHLEILERLD